MEHKEGRKMYKVLECNNAKKLEDFLNEWGNQAWRVEYITWVERTKGGKKKNDDLEQLYVVVMSRSM